MEFKPPRQIQLRGKTSVFLAGTIDQGDSYDWQASVAEKLRGYNIDIYNPRRANWDSKLTNSIEEPDFYLQVNWELDAILKADWVIVNFESNSKSPITLLELGLLANSGKALVCCPRNFYRSGNVQIVCNNFNIPLFENISELVDYLIIQLKQDSKNLFRR